MIENRTHSSLHPKKVKLDPYQAEEMYKILASQARKALQPQSLQKKALKHITSSTANTSFGLQWLRLAAEQAQNAITTDNVESTYQKAHQQYVSTLLSDFTNHHRRAYTAVQELAEKTENSSVQAGPVIERYRHLCNQTAEEALSKRRISDYIKHLEILDTIEADYHYGGTQGKTRKITLKKH